MSDVSEQCLHVCLVVCTVIDILCVTQCRIAWRLMGVFDHDGWQHQSLCQNDVTATPDVSRSVSSLYISPIRRQNFTSYSNPFCRPVWNKTWL